jgi:two-component system LytT family response regulator/two-component system response regulator LytT
MRERATVTLSTVLVDDEELARDELKFLLQDFPEVDVIATGSNGLEAVDLVTRLEPDLLFLDVQMPGLDGVGVVRKLREKSVDIPHIVFSTAYDQYAVEAFRLEASDYLLKPIDKVRLAETIARVAKAVQVETDREEAVLQPPGQGTGPQRRSKILVRSGQRNVIVDAADLIYATIEDGIITVVAHGVEGLSSYKTLEELQENLDPELFWRAHRSYIVNVNRIREVVPWFKSSYQLRMDDKKGTEIPVSRVQTRRLREMLKL